MKKTIGLISANYSSKKFGALTAKRTPATLPYGGRYRLIDFPLSNMVNAGIKNVGVVTPYNYRSVADHIGEGKPWSLNRKVGGMFILPGAVYGIRSEGSKFLLRDIITNRRYIDHDDADYVLFCGTNKVFNMDFTALIEQHERNAYPITVAYQKVEKGEAYEGLFLDVDDNKNVTGINYTAEGEANYFLDCFVIDREFLISFMDWFDRLDYMDIMEIVAGQLGEIGVDAYEFTGYVGSVNSMADYLRVNFDTLKSSVRAELFGTDRKIYTKIQDEAPALYRPGSNVKNSLISSGCIIEGEVVNCILSRSTVVKKGAKLENCIIAQHAVIGEGAVIKNAIFDKYVEVGPGVHIEGSPEHPLILSKNEKL